MRRSLTNRREAILDFLVDEWRREGRPPSLSEIGEEFDVTYQAAQKHVAALVDLGYIKRLGGRRCLVPTDKALTRNADGQRRVSGVFVGGAIQGPLARVSREVCRLSPRHQNRFFALMSDPTVARQLLLF